MHLGYCTNIHPAETWEETRHMLASHVLAVRDELGARGRIFDSFPIGLRLSARAARELLQGDELPALRDWLASHRCHVFTLNGFPYGAFHRTRVKERVYQPDWTDAARLDYTRDLFSILAAICPSDGGSISTLPVSFKAFQSDETQAISRLLRCACEIERLAEKSGLDLHLGLEPEPLGHLENTAETLAFFERLLDHAPNPELVRRRIGVNFDTCHFAIEFEDCAASLTALAAAGIRISKIHLSSALACDPRDPSALAALRAYDEATYLHQVIVRRADGSLARFTDLPDFLVSPTDTRTTEARCHFHIPLHAEPGAPLRSTRKHAEDAIRFLCENTALCRHVEIETYTWAVLPAVLQQPVTRQIASEFQWTLEHFEQGGIRLTNRP